MKESTRDRYVTYLTNKFNNRFFWIVMLILLALELFVSAFYMHDFTLFIIGAVEAIIIFGVQKLLQHNVKSDNSDLEYKDKIIDGRQVRIATLNFRVIDVFIMISFAAWIIVMMFRSSLHLNQILIVAITGSALASTLTCLAIVISLIYYLMKN